MPGDRFIIRQFSPVTTIGGGCILDNQPPRHRPGDPATLTSLRVLEHGGPEARLELLTQQMGEATPAALVARTGWDPADVLRVAKSLEGKKRVTLLGQPAGPVVHLDHFEALAKRIIEQLQNFHAANPLVGSLPKEDLRARVGGAARSAPSSAL